MSDVAVFSELDRLLDRGGNSAVIHAIDTKRIPEVSAFLWSMMRGKNIAAMRTAVSTCDPSSMQCVLNLARYANSGGAQSTMSSLLTPADRRVMRLVSKDWRRFLSQPMLLREEKAADEGIGKIYSKMRNLEVSRTERTNGSDNFEAVMDALLRRLNGYAQGRIPLVRGLLLSLGADRTSTEHIVGMVRRYDYIAEFQQPPDRQQVRDVVFTGQQIRDVVFAGQRYDRQR